MVPLPDRHRHWPGSHAYASSLSQVILSFGLPFAIIPLLIFTSRRDLMGVLVNRRTTTVLLGITTVFIVVLNVYLLYQTIFGA